MDKLSVLSPTRPSNISNRYKAKKQDFKAPIAFKLNFHTSLIHENDRSILIEDKISDNNSSVVSSSDPSIFVSPREDTVNSGRLRGSYSYLNTSRQSKKPLGHSILDLNHQNRNIFNGSYLMKNETPNNRDRHSEKKSYSIFNGRNNSMPSQREQFSLIDFSNKVTPRLGLIDHKDVIEKNKIKERIAIARAKLTMRKERKKLVLKNKVNLEELIDMTKRIIEKKQGNKASQKQIDENRRRSIASVASQIAKTEPTEYTGMVSEHGLLQLPKERFHFQKIVLDSKKLYPVPPKKIDIRPANKSPLKIDETNWRTNFLPPIQSPNLRANNNYNKITTRPTPKMRKIDTSLFIF